LFGSQRDFYLGGLIHFQQRHLPETEMVYSVKTHESKALNAFTTPLKTT